MVVGSAASRTTRGAGGFFLSRTGGHTVDGVGAGGRPAVASGSTATPGGVEMKNRSLNKHGSVAGHRGHGGLDQQRNQGINCLRPPYAQGHLGQKLGGTVADADCQLWKHPRPRFPLTLSIVSDDRSAAPTLPSVTRSFTSLRGPHSRSLKQTSYLVDAA